tara:strand:+ start:329 stop:688 length:360 start_codon:yes stop_codon:yes gene_type:complete
MTIMTRNNAINYLEIPSTDLAATKQFFSAAFNWQFTDYGPDYTAFTSDEMSGGFYRSDKVSRQDEGATLIVFYTSELENCKHTIEDHSGTIIKPIFSFPGGRRFHFTEPGGSEFAVWSE